MKTRVGDKAKIGDLSNEFALASFFPMRVRKPVEIASELCFAFFNMCGFVNCVRNALQNKADKKEKQLVPSIPTATKPEPVK